MQTLGPGEGSGERHKQTGVAGTRKGWGSRSQQTHADNLLLKFGLNPAVQSAVCAGHYCKRLTCVPPLGIPVRTVKQVLLSSPLTEGKSRAGNSEVISMAT